jgi:hypothetical protein
LVPLHIVDDDAVIAVGLVEAVETLIVCVTPPVVKLQGEPSTLLTQ